MKKVKKNHKSTWTHCIQGSEKQCGKENHEVHFVKYWIDTVDYFKVSFALNDFFYLFMLMLRYFIFSGKACFLEEMDFCHGKHYKVNNLFDNNLQICDWECSS